MTKREKAIVLCWVANLFRAESDEIVYRWPPPDAAENARSIELARESERVALRAEQLGQSEPFSPQASLLWAEAQARWIGAEP